MKQIPSLADAPDFQPVDVEVELPEKLILFAEEKRIDLAQMLRHAIMQEMGVEPVYPEKAVNISSESKTYFYPIK